MARYEEAGLHIFSVIHHLIYFTNVDIISHHADYHNPVSPDHYFDGLVQACIISVPYDKNFCIKCNHEKDICNQFVFKLGMSMACWRLQSLSLSGTSTNPHHGVDYGHGHEWSTHIPFVPCHSALPFLK